MQTALVLGASSQDGAYLSELLVNKGYQVIGTIRPESKEERSLVPRILKHFILETADLLSFDSIASMVKKYKPEEFYNLAAYTAPASSWQHTYLVGQVTGLGPVNCLEAIRLFSPRTRFFQASSREIFGNFTGSTADENTPLKPINPYAAAKAYAHFMTQCYRHQGLFATTGILFNHESPRRGPDFVTRKVASAAASIKLGLKSDKLELGNLDSQRDWGFAGDYVEAMWHILQYEKPDDWVVATGEVHTVKELCEAAFSVAGLDWKDYVVINKDWIRPTETGPLVGDYSKIKKLIGWEPKVKFKELIEMMVRSDLARLS